MTDEIEGAKVLKFKPKLKPQPVLTEQEQAEVDAKAKYDEKVAELTQQEAAGEPCASTILLLESALKAAKAGEISGLAMLAWQPKLKGYTRYNCMSRTSALDGTFDLFAMQTIGALELLKSDLSTTAFYREQAAAIRDISDAISEGTGG